MKSTKKINPDINQNILPFKPHNFENLQQNLIISKSATIYHCSSTMDYGIDQDQKLGKQNRNIWNVLLSRENIVL